MPFRRKLARAVLYVCAALGALMLAVTFTPVVPWYARLLAGDWTDGKGDTLIVLGGGTIDNRTLAHGSYWRCIYGDLAWREGGFRNVVVSGEGVAPLMRDFLVCRGVPPNAILVENSSASTRENALNTKALLAGAPGTKVLLTSDYHMFRARRVFEKVGLNVIPRPFPDALKTANRLPARWEAFLTVSIETVKIVYYRLRGWI